MQKKTVVPTRTTRAEVETPPRRTEENDPFIRRLGDLWRAAKEHDQHETAQLVQDMLLTYKGLKKRRDRRWFARKAHAALCKLEAPYIPSEEDFIDEDNI